MRRVLSIFPTSMAKASSGNSFASLALAKLVRNILTSLYKPFPTCQNVPMIIISYIYTFPSIPDPIYLSVSFLNQTDLYISISRPLLWHFRSDFTITAPTIGSGNCLTCTPQYFWIPLPQQIAKLITHYLHFLFSRREYLDSPHT